MPPLTLRRCHPIASSTALQCAQRRMPRKCGIRRCAHGEEFFRFREAKRWENSFHASATDLRAGMGKMYIVRTVTEVPDTGRPSLSALWNAMELAIGKLCRSVSAGIGQIGVLSSFPLRPHYFINRSRADSVFSSFPDVFHHKVARKRAPPRCALHGVGRASAQPCGWKTIRRPRPPRAPHVRPDSSDGRRRSSAFGCFSR